LNPKDHKNIELVAFDLGNVLCDVDEISASKKLASISGLSPEVTHQIAFGKRQKLLFESGKMSFKEHVAIAIKKLGISMSNSQFTEIYDSVLIPSFEMFPLVRKIERVCRVALVSNTSEPHWSSARQFLPFSSRLCPVILSYSVHAMKPDPTFYDALLKRSSVPADRILFIDDLPANVEAAKYAGMHGHRFTTRANLESELTKLSLV
jgi:FMN phosphatase YigB (HAD superfamily)